jgi:hypothetical protein
MAQRVIYVRWDSVVEVSRIRSILIITSKKETLQVICRGLPIRQDIAYSFCFTGAETEIHKIKDDSKIDREKNIDRRGLSQIGTVWHILDPPIFSLPTTFKGRDQWETRGQIFSRVYWTMLVNALFSINFAAILFKIYFLFCYSWLNRQCAANISIALKMNKCNGAANHFAPMYWCCQHQENPRKGLLMLPVCSSLPIGGTGSFPLIYWCNWLVTANRLLVIILKQLTCISCQMFYVFFAAGVGKQ